MTSIPDKLLKNKWLKSWHDPHVLDFIRTGSPSAFSRITGVQKDAWGVSELLPAPTEWNDEADRLLQIVVTQGIRAIPVSWLRRICPWGEGKWHDLSEALEILRRCGVPEDWIESELGEMMHFNPYTHSPTPAGRLLLNYDDERLTTLLGAGWYNFAPVLASQDPARIKRLIADRWAGLIQKSYWGSAIRWDQMVRANPDEFHEMARDHYADQPNDAAHVIFTLAEAKPELYRVWAISELKGICQTNLDHWPARDAIDYLLKLHAPGVIELVEQWLPETGGTDGPSVARLREQVLEIYRKEYPHLVRSAAEAMARSSASCVVLSGLKVWKAEGIVERRADYVDAVRRLLRNPGPVSISTTIAEAAGVRLPEIAPELWPLMEHKSAPVRGAAARALSGLGFEAAKGTGVKLLHGKKADLRQVAVTLFQRIGGAEATKVLQERLDVEESDAVRDAILLALDADGGVSVSPDEFTARMQRTLAKTKGSPVKWLDPATLGMARSDGTKLNGDEVLYLLIRQSRCGEMRADIEARSLIASLDRSACAPAALQMLEAFLASGQDASDRWLIALAALTGDDRLVPPLHKAILTWAENARGKLAEFAAGALALLGTDSALTVLESLLVRFRSKNKNIGQAASDAFMAAAEARGVTVEELGDMVVPWLGFEPGVRRVLQTGTNAWEMWIGPDFKPVYRDTATGKKLTKLPAAAGTALLDEQKIFAANLKEAVKAQLLRIETLLVRQFHWPVARWRELYLGHPLLRPFSEQLIWRSHPSGGGAPARFRSLGDGGLTNADGDAFKLPADGSISLLHPLDLSEAEKETWETHLSDYAVLPPFPQLQRPVLLCPETDRTTKVLTTVVDTELNAMTFRGRSEKLGWVRSSVCDGGMVSAYRKVFSGTGVEAFLGLDGMYVGIGMEESVTLGNLYFVKSGSVKVGSYTYDEPESGDDPRAIALGDVPRVAFSEVMADLYKISGKTPPQNGEPASPAA